MKILVIGGTRFMGKHLVRELLKKGHDVTIATRGVTEDRFGDNVNRIIIDRVNEESLTKALDKDTYDVIYDSISFCSNDAKILLEHVHCNKYIVISTAGVYEEEKKVTEGDFTPLTKELIWCGRTDFSYCEIKRQMEAAVFQVYKHFNPIAVRFPLVIGEDDYTDRFEFYVKHILEGKEMSINNVNLPLSFVRSDEAGKFLAFLVDSDYVGPINGASEDNLAMKTVIEYVEEKSSKKAIISESGEKAPYDGLLGYSLDTALARKLGYNFTPLKDWIYDLIDYYIKKNIN